MSKLSFTSSVLKYETEILSIFKGYSWILCQYADIDPVPCFNEGFTMT